MPEPETNGNSHTNDPFSAPQEQSNVNNCGCFGIFMVPLAAMGGFIDQILQKGSKKSNA